MNENVTVIDIVAQVTDETAAGAKSAQSSLSKLEKSMIKLQKQMERMKGKSKLEIFATLKDMASKGIQNLAEAGKRIGGKVWTVTLKAKDLVTAPFKKIWGLISNPVTQAVAFTGVSLGLADTVKTGMGFESAMASAAATANLDLNKKEDMETYKKMEEAARSAGATTTKTAIESANALEYMFLAGWDVYTSIDALPKVLKLSEATEMDLAKTSDMVTDSMAALGLTADRLPEFLDKVTKAQNSSNMSAEQLLETYLGVGGQFQRLDIDLSESIAAIGVLANRGTKGSEAATALNAIISNLTTGIGEAGKMMNNLHISAFEDGKFIGLESLFQRINDSLEGMTDKEKSATLAALGGKEHVDDLTKVLAGLNTTVAEGVTEWDAIAASVDNSTGSLDKMARTKTDTLVGSLEMLRSAVSDVQISLEKKLGPYIRDSIDWVTAHMPDIQNAVGSAVDFVTGKIDSVKSSVESLTGSGEWQKAETLWDKIHLAWDKLVAEPFDTWWNGKGKTWLTGKAGSIGEGLGTALKNGILGLLGIDASGAMGDGMNVGKSFFDGFMQGFDWKKVASELGRALWDGLKSLFSDAATLFPGGKEASSTSLLSAGMLGYGTYKVANAGYGVYKGVKSIGSAIGTVTGISEGMKIFKAAQGGGNAAQSALAFAQNGALGRGVQFGTKLPGLAAKAGKFATKAAPVLAGVTSAIQMGIDAYHGVQNAKEWTGSDSTGNRVASGIGAALGGTGSGIFGGESVGKKALDLGGGALKGAGIGAAVGSIVPGVGSVIGAAVGAGLGALGAAVGGENIAKAVSKSSGAIMGFFTETIPQKGEELIGGIKGFFESTVAPAAENVGNTIQTFFTETVPRKAQEIWNGVLDFFTKTIPNAVQDIGEGITGFFSGIKQKISNLWNQVTGFFSSESSGITNMRSGKAIPKHAEGGILTTPHLGLVAEDGAEAIIPLSGKRRERGIGLWEKAGRMLGVMPYADGGITGASDDTANQDSPRAVVPLAGGEADVAATGRGISVSIGQITFEIHVDGGSTPDAQSLVAAIKENIRSMTDEIAYQLAVAIKQVFANTPKAEWSV